MRAAYELCRKNRVLFVADEIQTGFGRTGKMFACDWEDVQPDVYVLGKAMGGGVLPVSAIAADREVLELFEPGSHGSTFGGNPLACAVAVAAIEVLENEKLPERSREMGEYFIERLREIKHPDIKELRGKGLFVGMELHVPARPYCEKLKEKQLLCKETHDYTIRFAPPLVISKEDLDWAVEQVKAVFGQ